jgi:pimeloyl-ACP methyl ester carboxylesterase
MDAVGSKAATVMAVFDAGPLGMVFAATKPERTAGLILANTARFLWAADHRFGTPREVADQLIDQVTERWGTEDLVWIAVPSRAVDERYRRWHARLQRSMASPGAVQAYLRALFDMDARAVLGSIHVPTLSCIARSSQWSRWNRAATSPRPSRMPRWSNWTAPTCPWCIRAGTNWWVGSRSS